MWILSTVFVDVLNKKKNSRKSVSGSRATDGRTDRHRERGMNVIGAFRDYGNALKMKKMK